MNPLEIEITCPSCAGRFPQRVDDLRPGDARNCPRCGNHIVFNSEDGRRAQKSLEDRQKSLKHFTG